MAKKGIPFEYKVSGLIGLILVLATISGISAFVRYNKLIKAVKKDTPKTILLVTEKLQNDLTNAENHVKSFSLTNDTNLINQFYQNAEDASEKLYNLQAQAISDTFHLKLDSLEYLVNRKLDILNEILLLQDQFRVQQALDKVALKIEEAAIKEKQNAKQDSIKPAKKKKFLSFLFKKKKQNKIKAEPTDEVSIADVNEEVTKVKAEEEGIETALKNSELELISADRMVSLKIYQLLEELKTAELQKLDQEKAFIKENVEASQNQFVYFIITLGLLLSIMSFVVAKYTQTNRRFKKAMNTARKRAEDLAKTKARFLANMSHEIRTPMNAIVGFTDQISEGKLDNNQAQALQIVQKSTNHLIKLVDDILDFTKLENEKLNLEKVTFELSPVIEETVELCKPLIKQKEVGLKFVIANDVPEVIIGDEFRLRQILINLISNAIKFTKNGSIIVEVKTQELEEESVQIQFKVIDEGIGMKPQQLKKVYKEFEQANNSISRNYGGTGLGLSITKMLVNLHGGTMTIDSEYKQGTTVSFTLPYPIGKRENIKAKELIVEESLVQLKNKQILLVDDEAFNRNLLHKVLSKYGCKTYEAKDGKQAIEMAAKRTYDLILMDARMPKMDGIKATKAIRSLDHKDKKYVPIICLSAAILEEDKINYLKAGMNDFLAKPIKERELLEKISSVLHLNFEVKKQSQEIPPSNTSTSKIDVSSLKESAQGDNAFLIDMLKTFLNSTEKEIQLMQTALQEKDWQALADHAHKIAPQCKHLAAHTLYSLLKEIEELARTEKEVDRLSDLVKQAQTESVEINEEITQLLQSYS